MDFCKKMSRAALNFIQCVPEGSGKLPQTRNRSSGKLLASSSPDINPLTAPSPFLFLEDQRTKLPLPPLLKSSGTKIN